MMTFLELERKVREIVPFEGKIRWISVYEDIVGQFKYEDVMYLVHWREHTNIVSITKTWHHIRIG